ncbi:unnamed protein product [Strongylus vulgaris]|uniref:C6 domain-containing protein n=1 Tax=Strongylus vulgaris TaxID=40348 RepID=A0A3P7J6Z2_STRVU|nr:unnamed protein product [Strongylus vulgaris]
MNLLLTLLILAYLQVCSGCAATSPGTSIPRTTTASPGAVTTIPITTTVAITTTTTTTTAAPLSKQNIPPGFKCTRVEAPDPATGCLRLTAICAAQAGFFGFMEFNINEGGPLENQDVVQVVEALLECRDGAWFYRDVPRQVNSVQCIQAPP